LEAICEALKCQPGELLEYVPAEEPVHSKGELSA
jgi:DNA-binding Xre family transcriptional regulator